MVIFLIVLTVAVVMIAIEIYLPGRSWPKVANWWFRAVLLNSVQIGSVFLAGVAWNRLRVLGLWALLLRSGVAFVGVAGIRKIEEALE